MENEKKESLLRIKYLKKDFLKQIQTSCDDMPGVTYFEINIALIAIMKVINEQELNNDFYRTCGDTYKNKAT